MTSDTNLVGGRRFAPGRRRWLRFFLMLVGIGSLIMAAAAGVAALWAFTILPRSLPSVKTLETFQPLQGSKVYDDNDELLTELHVERRIFVPLAHIPQTLRDAVIATEDRRFYSHFGVDPIGIARAVYQNYRRGRIVEGGSTITQQLTKVLFLTPDKSLERKMKEAALAFELERRYPKDRILEMYLNQVYFGNGAYGVEAASRTYFGKSVTEIGLREAALLAGLPRAPTTYSPFDHPDAPSVGARSSFVASSSTARSRIPTPRSSRAPISASSRRSDDARPASTSSSSCSRRSRASTAPTWSSKAGSTCIRR